MLRIPQGRSELVGCVLAAAIVLAPFLALRFGLDAGLGVAAAALATTAFAARDRARGSAGIAAKRLAIAVWVNAALAAAMVALLVLRRLG